jgi:hypothetical protein
MRSALTPGIRGSLVAALSVVGGLLACSSAAAQITIGQTAPPTSLGQNCQYSVPYDQFQSSVGEGAPYVVPAPGGAITSWSTNARAGFGQGLGLKVFRPTGPVEYSVVGHDGPRSLTPSTLNTFPVAIPVAAGDIIGVDVPLETVPTACEFPTGLSGDIISFKEGDNADGSSFEVESSYPAFRVNLSATLLPPPTLSGIAPALGSTKGGTSTEITGSNFADVTGVSFGGVRAASFTVDSESQITAVSPQAGTSGAVDVAVSTVAGSSAATAADHFTYEAAPASANAANPGTALTPSPSTRRCVVPKLKGHGLKADRKRLQRADCRLGRVSGTKTKTAKVVEQKPKAGRVLAANAKITVTVRG